MNNQKHEVSRFIKSILRSDTGLNNLVFLTIRFCNEKQNMDIVKESTRLIMSRVLFKLQGRRWYKKPCHGLYIIENGKRSRYHTHIILNLERRNLDELDLALQKVKENCPRTNICYDIVEEEKDIKNFNPNKNHICVMPVYDLDGLIKYVLKEFNWNSEHINFDAFYTEKQIFSY